MSIFERIQRIARANINLLLNRTESPEQMLEEKIRELQSAIDEGKEAAGMYGATFHRLEREQHRLQQEQQQWQARAREALQHGDEALARRSLDEKIKVIERLRLLEPGLEQGRVTYEQLRADLRTLLDQLAAVRMKQQELKGRQAAVQAQLAFGRQMERVTEIASPAGETELFEDQVAQQEAVAEIENQVRADLFGDDQDLERRSRDLQVEAELQALRAAFPAESESET